MFKIRRKLSSGFLWMAYQLDKEWIASFVEMRTFSSRPVVGEYKEVIAKRQLFKGEALTADDIIDKE